MNNLGIRLLHAKPFHAWSKGKVERLFHTLQQQFEKTLCLPGEAPFTLEELNDKLSCWLQSEYHPRLHSSTGQSPEQRFTQDSHLIRLLDPHLDLDRLFYHRLGRTVRKDGTIRLDNRLYEVDLALRHLKIQIQFDPHQPDRIEVYHKSQPFGLATLVDHHLNSQLRGHYEKR